MRILPVLTAPTPEWAPACQYRGVQDPRRIGQEFDSTSCLSLLRPTRHRVSFLQRPLLSLGSCLLQLQLFAVHLINPDFTAVFLIKMWILFFHLEGLVSMVIQEEVCAEVL